MNLLKSLFVLPLCLAGFGAQAEPVKLKFAFFTSDKAGAYTQVIKPFIDAVNAEAPDVVKIEAFPGGVIEPNPNAQLEALLAGKADFVVVVPGVYPQRFGDIAVIELPGLFRSAREATITFTRMVEADAMKGFHDLLVVGAVATEPETIHTIKKAGTLDELKGLSVRANQGMTAKAAKQLGMVPVDVPLNQIADALSSGKVEGAVMSVSAVVDYGIARVAGNHYTLRTTPVPLLVLMSRKSYDGLPPAGQAAIRKFSGTWVANRFAEYMDTRADATLEQLRANKVRQVVAPSEADQKKADAAFAEVTGEWEKARPENAVLAARAREILAAIRAGQ